jgi:signal transduction histidine kinase
MRLSREGNRLSVAIADDGKGFQVGGKTSGFGLASMTRRVEEMKGSLWIDLSPGKGTEIGFTVFAG